MKMNTNYTANGSGGSRPNFGNVKSGAKNGNMPNQTAVQPPKSSAYPPMKPDGPIVLPPDNINNQRKFTGRNRLFVGNLPKDFKDDDFRGLFTKFGEISESYVSEKGFGFVTFDTRMNAQCAKTSLDGQEVNGRQIRVRFATHAASVKVKEVPAYISNELLFEAFTPFGEVERAVHIVDDKGHPTGEAIVDFVRKQSAQDCLRKVAEGVFLLTWTPKPIVVENCEQRDDEDGLAERMIPKNANFIKEREKGPRFAPAGTFEHQFGGRWKELYATEKLRRDQLEAELQAARERLSDEMESAYQDYQASLLREDLRRRQEELDRIEQQRRQRQPPPTYNPVRVPPAPVPGPGFDLGSHPPSFFPQFPPGPIPGPVPDFSEPPPLGSNKRPADDKLVHGVEKLLKMYAGGISEGIVAPGSGYDNHMSGNDYGQLPPGNHYGTPAENVGGHGPLLGSSLQTGGGGGQMGLGGFDGPPAQGPPFGAQGSFPYGGAFQPPPANMGGGHGSSDHRRRR